MRSLQTKLLTGLLAVIGAGNGVADEDFSLVINPFTGAAELRNDGSSAVELDSYFITSPANLVLDPNAWSSLEDNSVSGWRESFSDAGNRLGELNLFESLSVPIDSSISIGNIYTPFTPTEVGEEAPGLTSIDFKYTLANESSAITGDVEFSARNTVVLVVDPDTGAAELENQSGFDLEIDGYLIKSVPGALSTSNWAPLSGSNAAWASSPGAANRIAEGNLLSTTPLAANGGSLSLGSPIDTTLLNDENDLILEFSSLGINSLTGGVLFRSVAGETGETGDPRDCSGDGLVDIQDANCTSDGNLDAFLMGLNPPSLRGDSDGNGMVEFLDFLAIANNFGVPGQYTDGDFNENGDVEFNDFLIVAQNFGDSSAAGAAVAVPEPRTISLALGSFLVWFAIRRGRKR